MFTIPLVQVLSQYQIFVSFYQFLQAEHVLAREQMEESERYLRCHLQGLRERNLECEDLKLALEQLRYSIFFSTNFRTNMSE